MKYPVYVWEFEEYPVISFDKAVKINGGERLLL
jgi:hypothetical protein